MSKLNSIGDNYVRFVVVSNEAQRISLWRRYKFESLPAQYLTVMICRSALTDWSSVDWTVTGSQSLPLTHTRHCICVTNSAGTQKLKHCQTLVLWSKGRTVLGTQEKRKVRPHRVIENLAMWWSTDGYSHILLFWAGRFSSRGDRSVSTACPFL